MSKFSSKYIAVLGVMWSDFKNGLVHTYLARYRYIHPSVIRSIGSTVLYCYNGKWIIYATS